MTRHITLFTANQVSPHAARAYGGELRRFMDHAGVEAPNLTIEHILDYRNALAGCAPATVAWKISIIRSFLSFLVQERIITHNPALSVKSPRVKRHSRISHFGPEHFDRLLEVIDTHMAIGHRNHCMIKVMGLLGLRVSEVCSLRLGQIQKHREQWVLSFTSKGFAPRLVPLIKNMDGELAHFMDRHRLHRPATAPLFPSRRSDTRPLTTRAVSHIVRKIYRQTGLEGRISPYDLRHFALSTLLAEGYDLFAIQIFAGHSQLATTAHYLHRLSRQEAFLSTFGHSNSLIRHQEGTHKNSCGTEDISDTY